MSTEKNRTDLIQTALSSLQPTYINIEDQSQQHANHAGAKSGGGHFTVTIISPLFQGKSSVQRHQMIYQALGDLMKTDIHAVSITAKTPAEG